MHEALLKLGFTEEQRDMVYTMFGICMHLGNIDFKHGFVDVRWNFDSALFEAP